MNKSESYELLIGEMKSISDLAKTEIDEYINKTIESNVSSENGTLYTVEIKVTKKENNTYTVNGTVHNNSSYKYELLEETLVVEK